MNQQPFGDGWGANVTHQKSPTIPFLTLHNGAMNVRDHRVSARNGYMCIDHEFRLGVHSYNNSRVEMVGRTLKT